MIQENLGIIINKHLQELVSHQVNHNELDIF